MTDHQPCLWPQHRQMVADGLGVGRADADIHQADPGAIGPRQVIGRHLVPPPCGVREQRAGVIHRFVQKQPTGARQRGIIVLPQLRPRPINEFIDIAVIVGEQDEALKILWRGAGVMCQPRQAEIGAQPIEQRQRQVRIHRRHMQSVRQFITDGGEFGGGKMLRQLHRAHLPQPAAAIQHIGERNWLIRPPHAQLHRVIGHDEADLLCQIIGKKPRAGDRHRIASGLAQLAKGAGDIGACLGAGIGQAQFGIAPIAPRDAIRRRQGAVGGIGGDVGPQAVDGLIMDADKFGDQRSNLCHRCSLTRPPQNANTA